MPCVCAREYGWQPKPRKAWRSREYLAFLHRLPCCVPECKGGPIEAAHFGGRGVGTKAHDFLAIPLCGEHHRDSHQCGRAWPYYDTVEHWQVQTMGAALASGLRF
jgi:hypothetical protein